jgi:prefoldin subunit 5
MENTIKVLDKRIKKLEISKRDFEGNPQKLATIESRIKNLQQKKEKLNVIQQETQIKNKEY